MDPQGRLLLEQTGLALQDARGRQGVDTEPSTGVYVGVMHMEFIQHLAGELLPPSPLHASQSSKLCAAGPHIAIECAMQAHALCNRCYGCIMMKSQVHA